MKGGFNNYSICFDIWHDIDIIALCASAVVYLTGYLT